MWDMKILTVLWFFLKGLLCFIRRRASAAAAISASRTSLVVNSAASLSIRVRVTARKRFAANMPRKLLFSNFYNDDAKCSVALTARCDAHFIPVNPLHYVRCFMTHTYAAPKTCKGGDRTRHMRLRRFRRMSALSFGETSNIGILF